MTTSLIGLDPLQLRDLVIAPSLSVIGLGSPAAIELMLGTALQESDCRYLRQLGGGPAAGLWMMERATHDDLWANYLASRTILANLVKAIAAPGAARWDQLPGNHYYACAMARLVYERAPDPLPAAGDLAPQAAYYKRHYNTPAGKATEAEYIANWRRIFPGPDRVAQDGPAVVRSQEESS